MLSTFANPIIAALEKPDPQGTARAVGPDGVEVLALVDLPKWQDTLTPIWSNAVLHRVPLNPSTRIEIILIDKDLSNDDAIGTGTVGYQDIVKALRANKVSHVSIARQTNRQALFIDVSVYPTQ